jgi:hypothetical protein
MRRRVVAAVLAVPLLSLSAAPAGAAPTCSDTLGIATHGQHIVCDYVTGIGAQELGWPPGGQVGGGGGAVVKGGPGPGFHFPNGFAPGASFCTGSNSPGIHL